MKFPYRICPDIKLALEEAIKNLNPDKVFLLCDSNTGVHCLPLLEANPEYPVFTVPAGESSKNLEWAGLLWQWLMQHNASRHSLLVNVGGGMITDLGGFVASTFKRGMYFFHVPTSLMAMIDAAHGGKNGINILDGKNMVGVFAEATQVLVYKPFLNSLDHESILSGFAEMIKHSLLSDPAHWEQLSNKGIEGITPASMESTLQIKKHYVIADPLEYNLRKTLNFGHTVGHAIESIGLGSSNPYSHGRCVAWGMMVELVLCHSECGFVLSEMHEILAYLAKMYGKPGLSQNEIKQAVAWIGNDKKNSGSVLNFTLLEAIGRPRINIPVEKKQIEVAFEAVQKFIL